MKKRQRTANFKRSFSLATTLNIIFCFTLFSILQFYVLDDIFLFATKINLKNVANEIIEIDFKSDDYKLTLSDYEANNSIYIEIYSPKDNLFYTSESNESIYQSPEEESSSPKLSPRIMRILSRTENEDGSYYELRQEYFATAKYVVYGNFLEPDIGIELYYSLDAIKDSAETAAMVLSMILFLILITVPIAVSSTTKRYAVPLRKIIDTTKRLANFDFEADCPTFKYRDLNELSQSVNTLSHNLHSTLSELERRNKKLETDIETQRKLEKVQRSFIANASHELKTPISIIQGYAEGMKFGIGCDSTDEFCDIIIDEAQKMNNLVVRLMEYMQYNSETYRANYTVFDLHEFINENIESRKIQFSEKGISVTVDIPEKSFCYADTILVENVFNNYISNAISHADFEKKIIISLKEFGSCYRISVFNTGKPIPGTDIEHIWDSFYRADKSHSREEGRFGLGLSIVATNQNIMGQKYGVVNTKDGPVFWFDAKKNL